MDFFEHIEQAPPDAIFGLSADFLADNRQDKVNLGAGVYKTADLKPFILNSVKKAESILLTKETSKDYLPIDGLSAYVERVKEMVMGKSRPPTGLYGAQTAGGTAALRIGGNFLKEMGVSKIYLSSPTWDNHKRVFQQAGLEVLSYPYFNWLKKGFDFPALLEAVMKMEPFSAILLQASCHNPTGIDPTPEEWGKIIDILKEREILPFFDLAYQGFGKGLTEDAAPLAWVEKKEIQWLAAISHSKNFGLYAERCGALLIRCRDEDEALRVSSRIKVIIRGLYSNPPCHGARIVATILGDEELKGLWEKELASMRERINEMRKSLVLGLQSRTSSNRFDFLDTQHGMFSYTGLNEEQVKKMTTVYGIYLPKDGRINIAGLSGDNINYVLDALAEAVK